MASNDDFPKGSLVEARGLKSRPDLNGRCGVANGRVQDGRVGVEFPPPDNTKALKPSQLILLREGGERASMPQLLPAPDVPSSDGPPAVRRRLLAYGDSLTAGYREMGRRFSPYGLALNAALLPNVALDVSVCGLSALTAEELAEQMDRGRIIDGANRAGVGIKRALKEQGPFDLVAIMLGTNDLGHRGDPLRIAHHVAKLHKACHDEGVRTVALSVPPNMGVVESKSYRRKWKQTNDHISEWAQTKGDDVVLYVDTEKLVPCEEDSDLWEEDGLHMTQAGSQRFGKLLAPLLAPVLDKMTEEPSPRPMEEIE